MKITPDYPVFILRSVRPSKHLSLSKSYTWSLLWDGHRHPLPEIFLDLLLTILLKSNLSLAEAPGLLDPGKQFEEIQICYTYISIKMYRDKKNFLDLLALFKVSSR